MLLRLPSVQAKPKQHHHHLHTQTVEYEKQGVDQSKHKTTIWRVLLLEMENKLQKQGNIFMWQNRLQIPWHAGIYACCWSVCLAAIHAEPLATQLHLSIHSWKIQVPCMLDTCASHSTSYQTNKCPASLRSTSHQHMCIPQQHHMNLTGNPDSHNPLSWLSTWMTACSHPPTAASMHITCNTLCSYRHCVGVHA
jgi:hypothetical protein